MTTTGPLTYEEVSALCELSREVRERSRIACENARELLQSLEQAERERGVRGAAARHTAEEDPPLSKRV